ncbi:MAG TPA: hypothetical protein VHZ33_22100 [Trebonia sp.]|nr:hypothetical protein [Trebonia sp.]
MTIVALVCWMLTAGVGTYLVATAARIEGAPPAPSEPVPVPAGQPDGEQAKPVRDPFAPPSLQRERSEELPLMRSLAEFAHPALAIVGLGLWVGYVLSRDRLILAIGLGVLLGAIGAGVSLFAVNRRAARRAAAAEAAGQAGAVDPRFAPQSFSLRALILHGAGAALTLILTTIIAVRA